MQHYYLLTVLINGITVQPLKLKHQQIITISILSIQFLDVICKMVKYKILNALKWCFSIYCARDINLGIIFYVRSNISNFIPLILVFGTGHI